MDSFRSVTDAPSCARAHEPHEKHTQPYTNRKQPQTTISNCLGISPMLRCIDPGVLRFSTPRESEWERPAAQERTLRRGSDQACIPPKPPPPNTLSDFRLQTSDFRLLPTAPIQFPKSAAEIAQSPRLQVNRSAKMPTRMIPEHIAN